MSVEVSIAVIPKSWRVAPLSELCAEGKDSIVDGPFGSNLKRSDFLDSGIPVLKLQNIKPNLIVQKNMDYVSLEKYEEIKRHSFYLGDIVMTKLGDPLGVSAIVNDIDFGVIVADVVRVRPNNVNTKFLCYQLNSPLVTKFLNDNQKGTTRPRINLSIVRELKLNVPPLVEQEKIVEILEEQLSRLDAALASVRLVRAKAARFRRSLLNSTLNGTFIESLGVVEKLPLSDCAEMSLGIMLDKAKGSGAHLTPYLGNINVRWGEFNQTDLKLMDIKPEQMERSLARKGDVVVCEGGEPGRTAVWNDEQPVAIQKALHRVRPFAEMDSNFIGYCLELEFRGVAEHRLFTGTTIKHLPKEKLKTLRIPKPPLQEQKTIVEMIEEQLSRLNASLAVADEIERKSSALRRSLLHAAFTGRLTKEWREGANA